MVACLIVYSLIALLSLIFSRVKQTNKSKKWFLFLCAVILITRMTLINPNGVQSDLTTYYDAFIKLKKVPFANIFDIYKYEYGYYILNWIVGRIFGTWTSFVIVAYGVIYLFVCRFIYKHSQNIYISIVLFTTLGFYGFSLTGIRQTMTMSICLWAYDYIKKRKIIPFILITLLAFAFHKSAILFLPLYFIGNLKLKPLNFILVFIICFVILLLSSNILQYFNEVFDKGYGEEQITSYIGRIIDLVIYSIVLLISYLAYSTNRNELPLFNTENNTFIYALLLGTTIYITQFLQVGIAYRLSIYFINIFIYVFVANIISEFNDKRDATIIKICFIVFSTLLFFIGIMRNNLYGFTYYI